LSKFVKLSLIGPQSYQATAANDPYDITFKRVLSYLNYHLDPVLCDNPDLIILPECVDLVAGFNIENLFKYYSYRNEQLTDYFVDIAKKYNTNIALPYVRCTPADEQFPFRNSIRFIDRTGKTVGIYDKNHCVIEENTVHRIGYGTKSDLVELDFAKVAGAICFDLNFDELLFKYMTKKPDLIVFPSQYHGGIRQEQWAFNCGSYFAGAICRLECRILNPLGETVARSTNYQNYVTGKINLDYKVAHLAYNHYKFRDAKKKYGDGFVIHDPGHLGVVLLTSEMNDVTVEDIVNEFEIELFRDYMDRALKHRHSNMDYKIEV